MRYFEVNSNGRVLRGMLHQGLPNIKPVLIIHGYFSANKIGPQRLFVKIAESLNQIGYTVIRIDLSGMGESDMDISEFEFEDHVYDVCCIVKKINSEFSTDSLHFIGHCIGNCTMLSALTTYSLKAESITMLSPFMPSKESYIHLLGAQQYIELMLTGKTIRKGIMCCKSYIDAGDVINSCNFLLPQNRKNVFAFLADSDEIVPLSESIKWAKKNNIPYKVIPLAEHNYLNNSSRQSLLIELTELFSLFYKNTIHLK